MRAILLSIFLFIPFLSFTQLNGSLIISGKVLDEYGNPLVAASVTTKGSRNGTITDSVGYFSLVINQKFPFRLVVSSIGFAQQEIEVKNHNSKLSVQLATKTY